MDLSEHTKAEAATPAVAGRELTLPLAALFRDPLNVRKKEGKSVVSLAALILSQSLLQNLVVREELTGKGKKVKPSGRFGVVAGGRRLEALQLLLSQRKITGDYPVRCLLVSQEDALSVSIAENSEREPLHGADLYDAFKAMIDMGKSVVQVADAWGISPLTVERRLKLAAVSPKLLALYREDGIELDQLMALTLADDHATQESVWENASPYERDAGSLRRLLTAREVSADAPLAVFVGLSAYEEAGGVVRRDLFSDDDNNKGVLLTDVALLERIAIERLSAHAESIKLASGLAWAEARLRFDWKDRRQYEQCRMVDVDPTPEQQEQIAGVQMQMDRLEKQWNDLDPDDDDSDIVDQQDQLQDQLNALWAGLTAVDPRDEAIAGVVVHLGYRGEIIEVSGLIRPEDRAAQARDGEGDHPQRSGDPVAPPNADKATSKPEFSERLMRQLTAHRTGALRACLVADPKIALRVLAYQLASLVFLGREHHRVDRPVEIRAEFANLGADAPDLGDGPALIAFEEKREQIGDMLPGSPELLLTWMLASDEAAVLDVLAFCTAATLNAVQGRAAPQPVADQIAKAVELDMADWWRPTRGSYLSSVPKAKVIEAIAEAVSAEEAASLNGLKKEALIGAAERMLQVTRWLPKPLRATD